MTQKPPWLSGVKMVSVGDLTENGIPLTFEHHGGLRHCVMLTKPELRYLVSMASAQLLKIEKQEGQ